MAGTREILLDLGEAAVRSRGYAGFSYADLARDAGIRKASIHHHFPAKSDLALALVDRYAQRLAEALDAARAKSRSAGAALSRAIEIYREALGGGSRMCLCAAMSTDAALIDERTLAALHRVNKRTAEWFADVFVQARADGSIRNVGDPSDEALSSLAILQGAQLLSRAEQSVDAFDRATALLCGRIGS